MNHDDPNPNPLAIIKVTSLATAAILMVVLQVTVFRAVGDIMSSLVIFGCGYAFAKLRG